MRDCIPPCPTFTMKEPTKHEKEVAEQLDSWMTPDEYCDECRGHMKPSIDAVLEFLHDENCLNEDGEKLAHAFWWKYIRED